MPIHWDIEQQAWVLGEVVTATTVRVYERVKPLRMQPKKGQYGSREFDTFIDKVFNPMLIAADSEVQQPGGLRHRCNSQRRLVQGWVTLR